MCFSGMIDRVTDDHFFRWIDRGRIGIQGGRTAAFLLQDSVEIGGEFLDQGSFLVVHRWLGNR